jgi:hypothetical protein
VRQSNHSNNSKEICSNSEEKNHSASTMSKSDKNDIRAEKAFERVDKLIKKLSDVSINVKYLVGYVSSLF